MTEVTAGHMVVTWFLFWWDRDMSLKFEIHPGKLGRGIEIFTVKAWLE